MSRVALLLSIVAASTAFTITHNPISHRSVCANMATANEDTDFDAPITKATAATPVNLDHEINVVDDECYLGKYGQHANCVDFDPIHESVEVKAKSEMPDFSQLAAEISNIFSSIKIF